MNDITFIGLWTMTHELLGLAFWPLIALGAAAAALALRGLLRRPAGLGRAAVALGVVGAVLAMAATPWLTVSGFGDFVAPLDWVLLALIGVAGAAAGVAVACAALGLMGRPGATRA